MILDHGREVREAIGTEPALVPLTPPYYIRKAKAERLKAWLKVVAVILTSSMALFAVNALINYARTFYR